MNAATKKILAEIQSGLASAIQNKLLTNSSTEMLRKRLTNVLAQIVGEHVAKIADEHTKVVQIQDETIMEIGAPLSEIIQSVFGSSVAEALMCDSQIVLKGWSKLVPVCENIDQTIIKNNAPPLPVSVPVAQTPAKARTARPRSRSVWQED